MKSLIKKIIPTFILEYYHKLMAITANIYYGKPSNKLVVIGVTGTNGKTTTVRLIADLIEGAGFKVALSSTAEFQIGDKKWLNDKKMTMLGRFTLQQFLCKVVKADCQFAVIETSSEGIKQFRHLGINYDIVVFTNLTPEHLESHGNFDNYKKAKGELFKHLSERPAKIIKGKKIEKVAVINLDDKYASYFLQFKADKKFGYTIKTKYDITGVEEIRASEIKLNASGLSFKIDEKIIYSGLLGEFNVYNVLSAVTVGLALGFDLKRISEAITNEKVIPGRMEFINEGQPFKVLIDYAPEPVGLEKLYKTIKLVLFNNRYPLTPSPSPTRGEGKTVVPSLSPTRGEGKLIIHVLGSCGGGRDKARRPKMGELAAQNAEYVIITNEDPYDEDPQEIINQVAAGAIKAGKVIDKNLFKILDRREAIVKALSLASVNDLVLITGKGCEQAIVVKNNKKIPWDDRQVVREELKKLLLKN